jgi:hypothetical protein
MKYLFLVLSILEISCDRHSKEMFMVDTSFFMTIEDKQGTDLLNPLSKNALRNGDVQLFYEIDGKRLTYGETSPPGVVYDNPSGLTLNGPVVNPILGGKYFLNVFGSEINVIKIKAVDEIKIIAEIKKGEGYVRIEKLWYENAVVWPVPGNNMNKYVRIVLD